MRIRLSGVVRESTVDGPGLRYTVFTQGCLHQCPGCHNPQTHLLTGGYVKEINALIEEIKSNPLISGITISGGEPFLQIPEVLTLTKQVKLLNKNIIIYTGYTYEELLKMKRSEVEEILDLADVLIDGRFVLEKRSLLLLFRGSSNQRVIDLKQTRKRNVIIEKDFSVY